MMRTKLLLVLLVAAVALPALADEIVLNDGRKLEGKIVKESDKEVEIKTRFGNVKVDRRQIESIEYKESADDLYQEKIESLDRSDPDAIFDLAMWCKENGKKGEYRKLLKDVLKLDGEHDGANGELGKTKFDDRWFTAKELVKYKEEKARKMEAEGYVFHQGRWMTQLELKKEMGYVEWEGEYVSQMEYYHKLAEQDLPKYMGYPMTITDSEHFSIRSRVKGLDPEELLDYCELEYEHFMRTFEPDETEARMIWYWPIPVYVLDDTEASEKFMLSGYVKRYRPPKFEEEGYVAPTNFSLYFPKPLVVLTMGRHLKGADDRIASQIGFMSHHVGHVLIRRFKRGGKVPGWVEAGVAHYYEGLTNFHQTVSICSFNGHEEVIKWKEGWNNFMEWKKKLIDDTNHPRIPYVSHLFDLKIETMDSMQMAKSWSVVTYLLKHHKPQFIEFTRRSYAPYRGEKELSQAKAWKLAFGDVTPEQVEEDWRVWIRKQPIAASREDRLILGGKKPEK